MNGRSISQALGCRPVRPVAFRPRTEACSVGALRAVDRVFEGLPARLAAGTSVHSETSRSDRPGQTALPGLEGMRMDFGSAKNAFAARNRTRTPSAVSNRSSVPIASNRRRPSAIIPSAPGGYSARTCSQKRSTALFQNVIGRPLCRRRPPCHAPGGVSIARLSVACHTHHTEGKRERDERQATT